MSCPDTITNDSLTLDQVAWYNGTSPAGRLQIAASQGYFLSIRVEMELARSNYHIDIFNSDQTQYDQAWVQTANSGLAGTVPMYFVWVFFPVAGTYYLEVAQTTGTPIEPCEIETATNTGDVATITTGNPHSVIYPAGYAVTYDFDWNAGEAWFLFAQDFNQIEVDMTIFDADWNVIQTEYGGSFVQIDFGVPSTGVYHVELAMFSPFLGTCALNVFCGVPYNGFGAPGNLADPFSIYSPDIDFPICMTPARITFTRTSVYNYTKHNWGRITGTGTDQLPFGGLAMTGIVPLVRSRTLDAGFVGSLCDVLMSQDLYTFRGGFYGGWRGSPQLTIANALMRFSSNTAQATPSSEYVVSFVNTSRVGAGFSAAWEWSQQIGSATPCSHVFSTDYDPPDVEYLPIV